jgi:ATP-dependent Clp protease ATP-binding subunit ClpA
VEQGLRLLGAGELRPDARESAAAAGREESLLARLGRPLGGGRDEPSIGRDRETASVLSGLLRREAARLVLIEGESGAGKSHLIRMAARRLLESGRRFEWLAIDLAEATAGMMFNAEKEGLLKALLDEAAARPDLVLVLEQMGCVCAHMPGGRGLLASRLDAGLRVVGTTLPGGLAFFRREPLARRLQAVRLAELSAAETADAVAAWRPRYASHHGLAIDPSLDALVVRMAAALPGAFPGKALALLDEAASGAALAGSPLVNPDDLYAAAGRLEDPDGS